jgi:hypothetical protein
LSGVEGKLLAMIQIIIFFTNFAKIIFYIFVFKQNECPWQVLKLEWKSLPLKNPFTVS